MPGACAEDRHHRRGAAACAFLDNELLVTVAGLAGTGSRRNFSSRDHIPHTAVSISVVKYDPNRQGPMSLEREHGVERVAGPQ